ncbi:hypothetical protein [Azonexus sp.]|jgi:hypothetical protein|uniref:hypothetical protein n=1 Tax=Azonexus sp. TaxID=1872668 RepID=UPI00282F7CFA|nr:hypothetical protein [Azonexus sp.]MDR1995157.1 hypothetical protein [Azonexus sp.]
MADFVAAEFLHTDFLTDEDGDPIYHIDSGSAGFTGLVAVVDGRVFETGDGLRWSPTVMIGALDVSARLSGRITITAAEDSARLATLDVMPLSAAELECYDSAPLTIDITIFTAAGSATMRRFTGRVEAVDPFDPVARLARITGRDGWQERPAACTTAAAVEALLGGLAQPCANIVKWEDNGGTAYFTALLQTMCGATAIDSNGIWRAIPWEIGSPAATFDTDDIYDESVRLRRPSRKSVQKEISATLSHHFHRLHASAITVSWVAPERVDNVVYGLPLVTKSMVIDAIGQLAGDGWLPIAEPKITGPLPGTYMVNIAGHAVPYIVSLEAARVLCQSVEVMLYRRWYQQATAKYTVTIDMGGLSERDDTVNVSIASEFDASAWESPPTATSAPSVYSENGPETPSVPAGYAALRGPFPPIGGALDHLDSADMSLAIEHVVALAVRRAAAGKRQQTVLFERPIDPRWEIGDVLGVDGYGISGVGQVIAFEDTLDIDSGEAVSALTLACPDGTPGNVGKTQYAAVATLPPPEVNNNFAFTPAKTHIGAIWGMDPPLSEIGQRNLNGFLCNALPTSANYSQSAPHYETQWRIVAPEIPAAVRDPLEIDVQIAADVSFSGSSVMVEIA